MAKAARRGKLEGVSCEASFVVEDEFFSLRVWSGVREELAVPDDESPGDYYARVSAAESAALEAHYAPCLPAVRAAFAALRESGQLPLCPRASDADPGDEAVFSLEAGEGDARAFFSRYADTTARLELESPRREHGRHRFTLEFVVGAPVAQPVVDAVVSGIGALLWPEGGRAPATG